MKNYPHLISRLLYEPLLLTPKKHAVFCGVVESALAGHTPKVLEDYDDERDEREEEMPRAVAGTQIINIHGTIGRHSADFLSGGCGLDDVHQQMDVAEFDREVERVAFDFRTPGGEVTGVPELARRIYRFPKETIAFCESECCSAGMWLASQCHRFYSTSSATLGSIGVWTAYLDLSRAMENAGRNMQAVFAGKYKLMGAYWKPLTDEEKGILQGQVDKIYAQFKAAMNAIRPASEDAMGNGLCFDGEEAVTRGLTDGVVERLEDILEEMV